MLDFSRRARLASSDLGRRAALMGAAALIALVGTGFLLAMLWTVLALELGWGSVWASLAIAILCLMVAGLLALAARKPRHVMPAAGDLTREIKARGVLASEAAMAGMRKKADLAGRTVMQSLFGLRDRVRHDTDAMADRLDATASRVAQAAHRPQRREAQPDARRPSFGPRDDAAAGAGQAGQGTGEGFLAHAARLRASPGLALVSAFAVGLALASAIGGSEDDDDDALDV